MAAWRVRPLEHTADVGYSIEADSRGELAHGCLAALLAHLGLKPPRFEEVGAGPGASTGPDSVEHIEAAADGDAEALVDALNEVLYLVQDQDFRPMTCAVQWAPGVLTLHLRGRYLASPRPLAAEIKAVTYHGVDVEESGGRWRARWIADV